MDSYLKNQEKYLERQKQEREVEAKAAALFQHQKERVIDNFTEYFSFLDSNYLTPVFSEGSLFPSVTHAFHAARTSSEETKNAILNADSLAVVERIASRIKEREDWSAVRLNVMEKLVRDKFRRSKILREKLKATGTREIRNTTSKETETALFWGVKETKGHNHLGRIIMKVREDVRNDTDLGVWLNSTFKQIQDVKFIPTVRFKVYKEDLIEEVSLRGKCFFLLGKLPSNDVQLLHPSISREHAAIVIDQDKGVLLVDLRSKCGSQLNGEVVRDHLPYKLKDGDCLRFAESSRKYVVKIDHSEVKKALEAERRNLERDVKMMNVLSEKGMDKEALKQTLGLKEAEETRFLFVSNMPYERGSTGNLKKMFETEFGAVEGIQWGIERDSGKNKSFCIIEMGTDKAAAEAVKRGVIYYENRLLKIRFSKMAPQFEKESREKKRYRSRSR